MARSNTPLTLSMALAAVVSAGACTADDGITSVGPYEADFAERQPVYDFATPPAAEVLSGQYAVTNRMDLSSGQILPQTVAESISALSGLRDDPARTMVELLVAADSPLVSSLLDMIPDSLEDEVFDVMNEYVFDSVFQSVPGADYLSMVVDDLGNMITDFEMITTLNVAPQDEYGNTSLSHRFAGIGFQFSGKRFVVYAPTLMGSISGATGVDANAVHLVQDSPDVEDARLYIGDHDMSVPVGKLAMMGLDVASQKTLHATSFRAALGAMFNCKGMAAEVVSYCPGGSCTSIEEPIAELCEAGLDEVIDSLAARLSDIQLDRVQFTGGEAAMYDMRYPNDLVDYKIDRIERGHWDLSVAVRADGEHILTTGSFGGVRIGDYQPPRLPNSGFSIADRSPTVSDDRIVGNPLDQIEAPTHEVDFHTPQDPRNDVEFHTPNDPRTNVEFHTADDPRNDVDFHTPEQKDMPTAERFIDDAVERQLLPGGVEALDPARAILFAPSFGVVAPTTDPYEQYGLDTIVTDALGVRQQVGGSIVHYTPNREPVSSGVGGIEAAQTPDSIIVVLNHNSSALAIFADR